MKITNYIIIFFAIVITAAIANDTKINTMSEMDIKEQVYNERIDTAVDDAMESIVQSDNGNIRIDKELIVQNFYSSLFANFGILNDPDKQNMLKMYVPAVVVIDKDGFWINYSSEFRDGYAEYYSRQKWTEKIPYMYEKGNLVLNFSLGDYLKIYDRTKDQVIEGDFHDLKSQYSQIGSNDEYDELRRNTIINCITRELTYYVNQHNNIAAYYGINYNFVLPVIPDSEWGRTIDDVGMIALFQGYPYAGRKTYNRFAFGAARLKKATLYYIQEEDGKKYYHIQGCSHLTQKKLVYQDQRECAKIGAYPCPYCRP